jgi:hypothetical protein
LQIEALENTSPAVPENEIAHFTEERELAEKKRDKLEKVRSSVCYSSRVLFHTVLIMLTAMSPFQHPALAPPTRQLRAARKR